MTSLEEFLKTGRLGPLSEGQTTQEVRDLLGEPEQFSVKSWPQLWKYGSLQLGFYRTSRDEGPFLMSTALYFRHPDEFPPNALRFEGWFPTLGCTYEEFYKWLGEAGINIVGGVTAGPDKRLVVGPGVRIIFDEDRLDSIQQVSKKEPDRKQVSGISVTRGEFDAIRLKARARGISVADLCSEWIKEQVSHLQNAGTP